MVVCSTNCISYQKMGRLSQNIVSQNHTQNMRFHLFISYGKEKDRESGFHYYGAR